MFPLHRNGRSAKRRGPLSHRSRLVEYATSALRTRYARLLGYVLAFGALYWVYKLIGAPYDALSTKGNTFPPSWKMLRQYEANLPQHDLDLPFPEGKTGRYVYFKNQIQHLGWNNQLNEVLMNAHLAYKSGRTYVFQDYGWKTGYYPWPWYKYRLSELFRRPRTPANALLAGPVVGGPWAPGDPTPRSISEKWFDIVCPRKERRIINTRDVKPPIQWENITVIFDTWQKLLSEAPERCIQIEPARRSEDNFPQVFDLYVWGSERILPIWEDFRDSPVSQLLKTAPIVEAAVNKNMYLFLPRGPRHDHIPASINPFDRMLAIHLRRGDFKEACLSLANWNSTFYSWNLHPQLPDKFNNPPGYEWGKNTPANIQYYLKHCLPTDEFLLDKIRKSREDYENAAKPGESRKLDVLFLMTNDQSPWLENLKKTMKKEGWHTVVTTKDLMLSPEELEVGMAVDMDIARQAAVFVGNGWSSFTSNIVHRRLVDRKPYIGTRFY